MTKRNPLLLNMFSGGLDSTLLLYKLLTEDQYKDYDIHNHHIHFKNKENRDTVETVAVQNIIDEIEKLGLGKLSISYTTLEHNDCLMHDYDFINFLAGNIAERNNRIETIAIGISRTTYNTPIFESGNKIFDICTKRRIESQTKVKKIYPLISMSKRERWESLPASLRELTWSCRKPIYKDDIAYICNKCHTCQQLKKATNNNYPAEYKLTQENQNYDIFSQQE